MIQKAKTFLNRESTKKLFQYLKWLILFAFLFFAIRYFQWEDVAATFRSLSIKAIILYVLVIFLSRILYAYRWKLIGDRILKTDPIPLLNYIQTNLLAEFVTIAMPTSLGGEVTRVLKLNNKGSKTTLSTASIFIDRILGIGGMLIVSVCALLLMGSELDLSLTDSLTSIFTPTTILIAAIVLAAVIAIAIWWLRQPAQADRISRAWQLVKNNTGTLLLALAVSVIAHIIFSGAHYFLLAELYPLDLLTTIAVILTPQLARSIPISVLGISAGEGMMVAGQMAVGMPKESALIITAISLAARYFFALLGFLIEFLQDGIHFFKQASQPLADADEDK